MVEFRQGYYVESTGSTDDDAPDTFVFYVGGEPPERQFILIRGAWRPLVDGFYLADKLITGDPSIGNPTDEPPEGVPPRPPTKGWGDETPGPDLAHRMPAVGLVLHVLPAACSRLDR